jgi:hypothetical protein
MSEELKELRAKLFSEHFGEELIDYHAKSPGSKTCLKYYANGSIKEYEETVAEVGVWFSLKELIRDVTR